MPKEVINLSDLNRKAVEEINRYKWIESEKCGHDIGEYQAAKEWILKYYSEWLVSQKIN
ncbi:MAG: hypothetical protein PHW04_16280 [Candidatus Wallbacteria bacterium]|nr:hypothetical protein [Candidatus Wallbacteria bacterium]